MIISHKYKFIFIKTSKTAGSSIEAALSNYCGKHDIITPLSISEERKKTNLGIRPAQNYMIPLHKYKVADWQKLIKTKKRKKFGGHMSAHIIKKLCQQYCPEGTWKNYFKFAFERHPLERVVSQYYFQNPKENRPSISGYLTGKRYHNLHKLGYNLYTINDQIVIDRICFYENLESEMAFLADRLGLPEVPVLPKFKTSSRSDRRPYKKLLTPTEIAMLENFFARELKLLDHENCCLKPDYEIQ